jgi:hypothetical protein
MARCRWKGKIKAIVMLPGYLNKKGWYLKFFSN